MLRAVVGTFLDSLSEREFDAPLLALLASQGFYDIHFMHGSFEFGKDVIAKRRDIHTGEVFQYAIQSKAGDVNQSDWRAIRPQIEECEYNTRAHPSFDETLSRRAILVVTGRLKGSAAVDAQEFKQSCQARGIAQFEVWDRETVLDWMVSDPSLGLATADVQTDLIAIVSAIQNRVISEPMIERFSRAWLVGDLEKRRLARASIEASVICNLLTQTHRLDLAALTALHLHRAGWAPSLIRDGRRSPESSAAVRLFTSYAAELLDQVEPLLEDPHKLLRPLLSPAALVTYPAACLRLVELLGLLALETDGDLSDRARHAVVRLCAIHPGAARPPADQFAESLIPAVVVLALSKDEDAVSAYIRSVAAWLLDRHDSNSSGLGLASLDEDEQTTMERLLGGSLETTGLERRRASYLATVVLDLLIATRSYELYEAVLANVLALQIHPIATAADELKANWRRGGDDVWPYPSIDYGLPTSVAPEHHSYVSPINAVDTLLLSAVSRSRHYLQAIRQLIESSATVV